jgi:hypothetical protein
MGRKRYRNGAFAGCIYLPFDEKQNMGDEKGKGGEKMSDTRGDGPVWLVDSVNLAIIPVIDGLCEAIRVTMMDRALGS